MEARVVSVDPITVVLDRIALGGIQVPSPLHVKNIFIYPTYISPEYYIYVCVFRLVRSVEHAFTGDDLYRLIVTPMHGET